MFDLTGCTYENDSAASRADRHHGRTSPYLRLPERESYQERAIRDGKVIAVREVTRWGGLVNADDWRAA